MPRCWKWWKKKIHQRLLLWEAAKNGIWYKPQHNSSSGTGQIKTACPFRRSNHALSGGRHFHHFIIDYHTKRVDACLPSWCPAVPLSPALLFSVLSQWGPFVRLTRWSKATDMLVTSLTAETTLYIFVWTILVVWGCSVSYSVMSCLA